MSIQNQVQHLSSTQQHHDTSKISYPIQNHRNIAKFSRQHMEGSSQPQYFFAELCVFADFAIAVIFYPVIKSL